MKLLLIGVIAFVVLAIIIFVWLKPDIGGLKSIALIMASVYNMLFFVVLMAYGLFNLPLYLWKRQDNKECLYAELEQAHAVRKEYRESLTEFYTTVN